MVKHKWVLIASLWLNTILIFAIVAGSLYLRYQRILWEQEGPPWAGYAGTMQAVADHDRGIRRFYRLEAVADGTGERQFSGERDGGIEVWSWPWQSNLGEASKVSTQAFVDAYNGRMRSFVAEAATRPGD